MASIFKGFKLDFRLGSKLGILLGLGWLTLSPSLQAQVIGNGVFQGDTTGNAYGDGSAISGAGLPAAVSISDFISYDVALNVARQANKIATAMQTNSFDRNLSTEAQQILLSLLTNPGFDTGSALTQKLKGVGISTDLARQLSDRLEGLFNPNASQLKKWQADSQLNSPSSNSISTNIKITVSGQQLTQAVETLNKVIETADPQALANPPDEFIVIQKVLAQLVIVSNQ